MFVNRENNVDKLTNKQVSEIYSGKVSHWSSDINNQSHQEIALMSKKIGHGTLDIFSAYFSLDYTNSRVRKGINFKKNKGRDGKREDW